MICKGGMEKGSCGYYFLHMAGCPLFPQDTHFLHGSTPSFDMPLFLDSVVCPLSSFLAILKDRIVSEQWLCDPQSALFGGLILLLENFFRASEPSHQSQTLSC